MTTGNSLSPYRYRFIKYVHQNIIFMLTVMVLINNNNETNLKRIFVPNSSMESRRRCREPMSIYN